MKTKLTKSSSDIQTSKLPKVFGMLVSLTVGERLAINGPLVKELVDALNATAIDLMKYVDTWLTANPDSRI